MKAIITLITIVMMLANVAVAQTKSLGRGIHMTSIGRDTIEFFTDYGTDAYYVKDGKKHYVASSAWIKEVNTEVLAVKTDLIVSKPVKEVVVVKTKRSVKTDTIVAKTSCESYAKVVSAIDVSVDNKSITLDEAIQFEMEYLKQLKEVKNNYYVSEKIQRLRARGYVSGGQSKCTALIGKIINVINPVVIYVELRYQTMRLHNKIVKNKEQSIQAKRKKLREGLSNDEIQVLNKMKNDRGKLLQASRNSE